MPERIQIVFNVVLILILVVGRTTEDINNSTGVILQMPKTSTEEEKVFLTTSQLLEGTTLPNDNLTDYNVTENIISTTENKISLQKQDNDKINTTHKPPLNISTTSTIHIESTTKVLNSTKIEPTKVTTEKTNLDVKPLDEEKLKVETSTDHNGLPVASPVPPVSHIFQATPGDLCPAFEDADRFTQTELLSRLTNDCRYDKLERPLGPHNGAGPLPVAARIYVYFIQNTDAHELSFSVTILLQFRYQDARLAYKDVAPTRTVIMGESQLRDKIWVPHVFVANERSSQVMGTDAQSRDVLVSVAPDGTVVFSLRMKATLYCWMNLRKFPFDEQQCQMMLESWKYNTSELLLTWEPTAPVTLAPELHLTEYVLAAMWVNETVVKADLDDLSHGAFGGTYSALSFTVLLSREMGYYLMDYFLPSVMIVSCSWVSFWLAADQSAPRVTLGTSTMLSFITLASAQGKTLPKVSYIKASEIWFLGCTGFIFGSLVEFAFVNTIWRRRKNVELKKVNSKYILKSTLTPRLARKEFHASFNSNPGGNKDDQDIGRNRIFPPPLVKARSCSSLDKNNGSGNFLSVHGMDHNVPTITAQNADDALSDQISVCVDGDNEEPTQIVHHTWTTMTPQEISMWIDKRSRICFPVAFAIFNFFYWIFVYYL